MAFMSEAQLSLIRRGACLEVELERLEGELANGGDVNLDVYGRSANSLRRILESLGIERKARPGLSLGEYLTRKEAERIKA
jgi:hypothetical protein